MAEHFGPAAEVEISSALTTSPTLAYEMANTAGTWTSAKLAEQYDAAVESLSSVDPLLAFRLSGKSALVQRREQMTKLLNLVTLEHAPGGAATEEGLRNAVKETVHAIIQRSALELVEDDILDVAARLGWIVRWRTHRVMRRTEEGLREERAAYFAEYFARIEPVLQQHQQNLPQH